MPIDISQESIAYHGMLLPKNEVGYDAVGGLDMQIQQIRELVELPLTRPDLYQHFGASDPALLAGSLANVGAQACSRLMASSSTVRPARARHFSLPPSPPLSTSLSSPSPVHHSLRPFTARLSRNYARSLKRQRAHRPAKGASSSSTRLTLWRRSEKMRERWSEGSWRRC